ncbi:MULTISPECIES: hypothetical protein [Brevundimonas]|jgi:hypothetical protein|uniref:hypothetical protein n=1 Tax=Brevundimonas TaxID=41275 RepID=UPI0015FF57D5|nr:MULTISPECIES: hypothetical protein [Brevundimonas]MBB1179889.1 hypothetical protein [Pseudomonas sp. FW305-3-2-15-E-TSA4]
MITVKARNVLRKFALLVLLAGPVFHSGLVMSLGVSRGFSQGTLILGVLNEVPAILVNMAIAGVLLVALSIDERIENRGA